jgi:hypothetical protein
VKADRIKTAKTVAGVQAHIVVLVHHPRLERREQDRRRDAAEDATDQQSAAVQIENCAG